MTHTFSSPARRPPPEGCRKPSHRWFYRALPSLNQRASAGPDWVYELNLDGYRLMVRRQNDRVCIYSRRGADFTPRFPRSSRPRRLKAKSVLINGEGIVYDRKDMPGFELIHSKVYGSEVSLVAFDLLGLGGKGARRLPLFERKVRLAQLIANAKDGIEFNEYLEGDGAEIFRHACKLGHEGLVAERKDLPYQSGRSRR